MLLFVSSLPLALASGSAPVAEAGLGVLAYVGDTVQLNGTGSTDPEGDNLTYQWVQVGGPEVELTGEASAQPSFTVGDPGTYRFELVVNDGSSDSAADDVEVVVAYTSMNGETGSCAVAPVAIGWLGIGVAAACLRRRR